MMISNTWAVDHIGIAVTDLSQAINHYAAAAGTIVTLRETLESQGVEVAFLNTGGCKLELLAAASGHQLIDSIPRPGAGGTRIAFISPKSFLGVLTELCEYSGT